MTTTPLPVPIRLPEAKPIGFNDTHRDERIAVPGEPSRLAQNSERKRVPLSETILPRVASGDRTAVKTCLDRYGPLVWSLARRFLSDLADAEDVVQEIFVDVWKSAHRFDPATASEATFIGVIARRRLIDHRRKRTDEVIATETVDLASLSPEPDAPSRLEQDEDIQRVRSALHQLRSEEREVLTLSIYQGLSQSAIAERLGKPLGTVKAHARRGLLHLRELIERSLPTVSQGNTLHTHPSAMSEGGAS